MTAKEMIEILQKYPPETPLIKKSDNFELRGAHVDAIKPYEYKVKETREQFRDAFDGETYTSKVYKLVFDKGEEGILALVL